MCNSYNLGTYKLFSILLCFLSNYYYNCPSGEGQRRGKPRPKRLGPDGQPRIPTSNGLRWMGHIEERGPDVDQGAILLEYFTNTRAPSYSLF